MLRCQPLAEMHEFVAVNPRGVERRPAQHGRVADVPKADRPPNRVNTTSKRMSCRKHVIRRPTNKLIGR